MAGTSGSSPEKTMPIMSHIRELQLRLVLSTVVLLVGASLAYVFRDQIINILLKPLAGQQLVYLTPGGGFSFILLVSIYAGLAVAAPIVIHQLYCFVRPALSKRVQKHSAFILLSSLVLLISGVTFGYFLAGLVPLLSIIIFPMSYSRDIAIVAALSCLLVLGYAKGRIVKVPPIRSAMEVLIIGGIATAIGIIAGNIFSV